MNFYYSNNLELYAHIFHEGKNYKSYEFLGAHFVGDNLVRFIVWADSCKYVNLIGDFNNWDDYSLPLKRISNSGLWEITVEGVAEFDKYKYRIVSETGEVRYKTDPYGFYSEIRPKTASKVFELRGYEWKDKSFLKNRKKIDYQSSPINIYEMNLLSWKKKDGHEINYNEIKIELVKYLKKLNYNYVEFMPLMEYPFDGSWGYQTTGFFNPTSRFGNPKELMSLIDYLHRNGIGVILDFVFVHFVKDDHGLRSFDGKAQFESSDKNLAENYDWGTLNFDLSKKEVRNFLISSALYWLDYYHIDGLRLDAVSYSLYYDIKNLNYNEELKSNINPNAISFIKEFNTKVKEYYPDIMIIAEESSSYPNICKKVVDGGLGFDFKWNMGWMNDIIKYMNMDPLFRKDNHKALTFPIYYQYTENFILPFSHDEVVHAKGSMLNKMFGNYEDRFKQLRLLYTYFYSEPGKKLLFMGGEFAQFDEWNEFKELTFSILEYPLHKGVFNLVKDLGKLYLNSRPLYELDNDPRGFNWLDVNNALESTIAFERVDLDGNKLICIFNFTPVYRKDYKVQVDEAGNYSILINASHKKYGGNVEKNSWYKAIRQDFRYKKYYINVNLEPFGALIIEKKRDKNEK